MPDDEKAEDLAMGMTLTFTNASDAGSGEGSSPPGNRSIASGVCGYIAESSEITTYSARRGRIIIESPAHCPTSVTMVRKPIGTRGNGATSAAPSSDGSAGGGKRTQTTVEFPLPSSTNEIEESGGMQLPNSMGFIYEAEAVRRLIEAGQTTFPQWTPEESVGCIAIIEEMLQQIDQ